jgi:hypothetical protein
MMMNVKLLVERELVGETEVLGENFDFGFDMNYPVIEVSSF